jgi:hypothetical protein
MSSEEKKMNTFVSRLLTIVLVSMQPACGLQTIVLQIQQPMSIIGKLVSLNLALRTQNDTS